MSKPKYNFFSPRLTEGLEEETTTFMGELREKAGIPRPDDELYDEEKDE